MDLDFGFPAAHGLRCYVRLVAEELGLTGESSYIQLEPPVHAYLAVDGRLAAFPARDVALLWDERHGWAAGVETDPGEELILLSYLDDDILPAPKLVACFVRGVITGTPGQLDRPAFRTVGADDDLESRLVAYAGFGTTVSN
jgi:uncharacterized protein DUF6292